MSSSTNMVREFAIGLARQLCLVELLKVCLEDYRMLDTVRQDPAYGKKRKHGETTLGEDAIALKSAINTYLLKTRQKVRPETWSKVHRDMKREQVRDISLILDVLVRMDDPGVIYPSLLEIVGEAGELPSKELVAENTTP